MKQFLLKQFLLRKEERPTFHASYNYQFWGIGTHLQ